GRAEARAANIPPTFDFVSIPFVEVAPADERRSQCLEESRTDRIAVSDIIGHHTASGLDREPLVPTASTQQFRDAQRGVLHFGQVSKRNQQIAYQGSRLPPAVPASRRSDTEHEQVRGDKSGA